MKPEAQNWLNLAQEAYEDCLCLFSGARHPAAVYSIGQAVEKILKAALIEKTDQPVSKTHDLESLARKTTLEFSPTQYQQLRDLRKHYMKVRYRDFSQTVYNTKAKVQPILEQGKKMYLWILTKLESH